MLCITKKLEIIVVFPYVTIKGYERMEKIVISQKNYKKESESIISLIQKTKESEIILEVYDATSWDSKFEAFLYHLIKLGKTRNIKFIKQKFPKDLENLLNLAFSQERTVEKTQKIKPQLLETIGECAIHSTNKFLKGLNFVGELFKSFYHLLIGKSIMRTGDFIDALLECGPKAIGIVGLISFMVGLILAFVGAVQLKTFGAEIYVASLVTIGMIRIMGAIMVGIIMAGRTGSSYAATIGTMQVNEELDALKTMGVSNIDFLVLPRLLAMIVSMPILVMFSDFMGMIGGAFVGTLMLDIPSEEYWKYALDAFGLTNFLVGIFHGFVFAFVIAICGSYYGINCGRNADSVGQATTKSVVSAIVWMIILTGIITLICEVLGI